MLFGYHVYQNGKIVGLRGKEINKNRSQIKIYWGKNKKVREVSYARFVYYAFHQDSFNFDDTSLVVRFKDGNKRNYDLNNLEVFNKKVVYQGEHNTQAKLTDRQVEEIKRLYNTQRGANININYPFKRCSYRKLARQYGVSHTLIRSIVKGEHRNKENYIIK